MTIRAYPEDQPFPGRVGTTLADSEAAWPVGRSAVPGSPNVLTIVLDDVGFAQLGCYGSDIATPAMDRLAAEGVRYRQFHTTAICSPTRACVLTGRNSHTVGMGGITDLAMGFPGYHGRIPKTCAFVPRVLRDAGWATYAVGKWHLAPSDEQHAGASRARWPLGQGFERYYGFIGAETHQFAPELVIDNTPLRAELRTDGYHLSEDLVDQGIGMIRDLRTVDPDKPFYMYLAFGACHAPHHVTREWIEPYRGQFDDGWDVWRERTHQRQMELGVIPQGTSLSPRPPWIDAWDSCSAEQRRAYARMMELYAGFLSHTDAQIGRLIEELRTNGELDRTLVMLCSDNGASAEGGPHGTFNEIFAFNGLPHDEDATMQRLDGLGDHTTYPHYPWGWAFAGNTPFQRWKRETHEGGIGDPLIVRWPEMVDQGTVRDQYVHAIDLAATALDVCGVAMPATVDGIAQEPLAGQSIAPSFTDPQAAGRLTQYYEQLACRAIYHDGWKAVAYHAFMRYSGETVDPHAHHSSDRWELYRVADDPSECHDLAEAEPERLRAMQDLWWREAGRYGALPLQSRRPLNGTPSLIAPRSRYLLHQGAAAVPENNAPALAMRTYRIVVDITVGARANGVLLAQGGVSGGWSLHLLDGRLRYAYNYLGIDEHTIESPDVLAAGHHLVGIDVVAGEGTAAEVDLIIGTTSVATLSLTRTIPRRFSLAGEGLCCGYDDATAVSAAYQAPFEFDGVIRAAIIDVSGTPYVDVAGDIERAWMTQ